MTVARWLAGLVAAIVLLGGAAAPAGADEEGLLPVPTLGEDGLHHQPWMPETFLDLREDLKEAEARGKGLALMWEQKGCPYCKETHTVNLRVPEVVDYIKANFVVLQMNLWGDREVTDFDGEVTTEKALARKYRVQFTPTVQFFPLHLAEVGNRAGADAEAWRLLGYWKPFHFLNSFVYVKTEGYKAEPNFQRWLGERAEEMRRQGKEVKLW